MTTIGVANEFAPYAALGVLWCDRVRVVVDAARSRPPVPPDTATIRSRTAMVRGLYRRFGIDPTKIRPSSEALLRRVRRGQPWPAVNSLVDVCNACSLAAQLPFGLYDADRIVGDIVFRRGGPGEEYEGIRKAMVYLAGRPALFDEVGPFGNPTSDSARTMVTTETARALVVVFAPMEIGRDAITDVLRQTAACVSETTGGVEHARQVLSGSGVAAGEGRA